MATSNNPWFVRSGGSANNSGGSNSDSPDINGEAGTPFVVAAGVVTYAPGGFNSLPADAIGPSGSTRALNVDVGGTRTVRRLTVLTDTTATIVNGGIADGSYNGSIGGARATPTQASVNTAPNNPAMTVGDQIYVEASTFTGQYTVTTPGNTDDPVSLVAPGATIDGTGGGAGTDCLTFTAGNTNVHGLRCINAVDDCYARSNGNMGFYNCGAVDAGGDGWQTGQDWGTEVYNGRFFCYARSCGNIGIGESSARTPRVGCESRDNTSHGYTGLLFAIGCTSLDNGGDGGQSAAAGRSLFFLKNTFSGSTGDGLDLTATTSLLSGSVVAHNDFSQNGGYGVNSSAGAQTEHYVVFGNNYDANNGGGSGLDRNNFNADLSGYAGPDADPDYVNAAAGDYTLSIGSPLYGAMVLPPFQSPMAVNIGATQVEEGSASAGGFSGIGIVGM